MASYSKSDVVLVNYPYSNRSRAKVRPAVVVSAPHRSRDVFVVPLTSKIEGLLSGEFVLNGWREAGLNVSSAVKRGLYTIHQDLIAKTVGNLSKEDAKNLELSLRMWLGL